MKQKLKFHFLACTIVMLSSFQLLAQTTLPVIKNGTTEKLDETNYCLVKQNEKTGLYNLTSQQYVIKPTADVFYYFDYYHFLFKVDKKNNIQVYNLNIHEGNCFVSETKNELFITVGRYESFSDGTSIFKSIYSSEIIQPGIMYDDTQCIFGVKMINGHAIIRNRCREFQSEIAMESLLYPGTDSLNDDGTIQYYPNIPGYNLSGVKSIKNNTWLIEPIYNEIYLLDNTLICLGTSTDMQHTYYDFYTIENSEMIQKKYTGVISNGGLPAHLIFNQEQFLIDRDSTFFYTYSNSGMGLMNIQLYPPNHLPDYSTYANNGIYFPWYNVDTIYNSTYEFVHKIGADANAFVAYDGREFTIKKKNLYGIFFDFPMKFKSSFTLNVDQYSGEVFYSVDGKNYSINYEDTSCIGVNPELTIWIDNNQFRCLQQTENSMENDNGMAVEKIGDSLIYIQFWTKEYVQGVAMQSIEFVGEDSVNENGEYVYYPNDPAYYESGIYDLKTKKWLIEPKHAWIKKTYDGFLICSPVLNENLNIIDYNYCFKNNSGDVIVENTPEQVFIWNSDYDRYRIPDFKCDSVFSVRHSGYPIKYFESNSKTGIVNLGQIKILHEPVDYVRYLEDTDDFYTITGDTLILNEAGESISFKLSQQKEFEFYPNNRAMGKSFVIYATTEISNELIFYDVENKFQKMPFAGNEEKLNSFLESSFWEYSKFKIEKLNDSLIYIEDWLSDMPGAPMYSIETGEELYNSNGELVYSEAQKGYSRSGVYNFVSKNWFIQPNYQEIKTCKGGFIALSLDEEKNEYYTFINHYGVQKSSTILKNEFLTNPENQKLLIREYTPDAIWPAGKVENNYMPVYFKVGKKIGMYDIKQDKLIVEPKELIYYNPFTNEIMSIENGKIFYEGSLQNGTDSRQEYELSSSYVETSTYDESANFGFGFQQINDSLIYLKSFALPQEEYVLDQNSDYLWPLLDEFGNHVSTYKAGIFQSGIYNIISKKWFIPAENYVIAILENAFLVTHPILDKNEQIVDYVYSIINSDGKASFNKVSKDALPEEFHGYIEFEIIK